MITLEQNTEEWLEFRKTKIGSSDAPIVMGESPWKIPKHLWEEKRGLREFSYKTAAMQRSKQLEAKARKTFELETRSCFMAQCIAVFLIIVSEKICPDQ